VRWGCAPAVPLAAPQHRPPPPANVAPVLISEVMTGSVVSADAHASLGDVAALMRDRNVGSVVICDGDRPVAMITDRDVALTVAANGVDKGRPVKPYAAQPLVTGEIEMDVEEAAAVMVQNRVRRLPVLDGDGRLAGIVTLDDLAVRTGDAGIAKQITSKVARAALPDYFFHQRGG
jgi:CBS domain-containing protein